LLLLLSLVWPAYSEEAAAATPNAAKLRSQADVAFATGYVEEGGREGGRRLGISDEKEASCPVHMCASPVKEFF
jgi:hypothetical protein